MTGRTTRIAVIACIVAPFAMATPLPALADGTIIKVELQDPSTGSGITDMKMVVDHSVVVAGPITLHAVNESKRLPHEVLVFRDSADALPYNEATGRLVEKQMNSLGEISDLGPGDTGDKTFTLSAGNYLLLCNQSNHLKAGMFARLKVVAAGTAIQDDKPTATMTAMPATKAVTIAPGSADDDEGS